MLAVLRGNVVIADFLLHVCGADVTLRDTDGLTAADYAVLCGHAALVELLLSAAPGDGTGRAFLHLQQNAEEFGETATTIAQRRRLQELNQWLCVDLSEPSHVAAK